MKKQVWRLFTVLSVILIIFLLPVTGAEAAEKVYEVNTINKLNRALENRNKGTIIFSTKKKVELTIPKESHKGLNLVINAPSATVTNKGCFKSVTVNAACKYSELGGNSVAFELNKSNPSTSVIVGSEAILTMSGTTSKNVALTVNKKGAGSSVSVSLPVTLKVSGKCSLTVNKGAKGTKAFIKTGTSLNVINNLTSNVKVTLPDKDAVYVKSKQKISIDAGTGQDDEVKVSGRLAELLGNADVKKNVTLNASVFTDEAAVEKRLLEMFSSYTSYGIAVSNINLLKDESYYLQNYPILDEFSYEYVEVYKNCIYVRINSNTSMDKSEFMIAYACFTGNDMYLNDTEKKIAAEISNLAASLKGESDYDTVKNIHDYLILNTVYDSEYLSRSGKNSDRQHTFFGPIFDKRAVCDGYAKAFNILAGCNKIDSILVSGDTNSDGTEGHAWNLVKLDDEWFSLDVTWDDPVPDVEGRVKYGYFLINDEIMGYTHMWEKDKYPKAESDKYADGIAKSEFQEITSYEEAVTYVDSLLEKGKIDTVKMLIPVSMYSQIESLWKHIADEGYYYTKAAANAESYTLDRYLLTLYFEW